MKRLAVAGLVAGAIAAALVAGCAVISKTASVPPKHPEDISGWTQVDCRECHTDVSTGAMKAYASFRHSPPFVRYHGLYARQGQTLCQSCHAPSFCQTCHAVKEELRPDKKMGDRPDLSLPHRGDYLVLHRLDGRLDPGSCFACHGNKDDIRCKACHK